MAWVLSLARLRDGAGTLPTVLLEFWPFLIQRVSFCFHALCRAGGGLRKIQERVLVPS